MIRAALALAMLGLSAPLAAAVYEVGADGSVERIDTPPPVRPAGVAHQQRHQQRPSASAIARAHVFRPDVERASRQYDVSPALIDAIAHVESRYNPAAVSPAKARGIMQLMPGTARDLGVDASDPAANIRGGTAYIRMLLNRFDGDVVRTIAAYNAGPAAVIRAGGVPAYRETQAYVESVLGRLAASAQ